MKALLFYFYITFYKQLFHRPIYRVDILKYVKYMTYSCHGGLCGAIASSYAILLGKSFRLDCAKLLFYNMSG